MVVEGEVCPKCKGTHIVKAGFVKRRNRQRQRLQCQNCGKTFYMKDDKKE